MREKERERKKERVREKERAVRGHAHPEDPISNCDSDSLSPIPLVSAACVTRSYPAPITHAFA